MEIKTTEEQAEVLSKIKELFDLIDSAFDDSRERSIALTKLQECDLWLRKLLQDN